MSRCWPVKIDEQFLCLTKCDMLQLAPTTPATDVALYGLDAVLSGRHVMKWPVPSYHAFPLPANPDLLWGDRDIVVIGLPANAR